MANSDSACEAVVNDGWCYFTPLLGELPCSDWQCMSTAFDWTEPDDLSPILSIDLLLRWRKPYTSKGN